MFESCRPDHGFFEFGLRLRPWIPFATDIDRLIYRKDIDGLRAIAVLPVILFHFNIAAFSGGFVGVDIFFVISGYLITKILADNHRKDSFSFLEFYARRAKRIFPVLFLVVFVTLAAGYFLLTPGDYEAAGESGAFAVGFLSNVFFWLNTGYFDASSDTMPLLHSWSLGVEEQFYIVWPLFIAVLWRTTRFKGWVFWTLLVGISALSLAANVVVTGYDPERAFYLPWFRAWQFAIGAAVGFLPNLKWGNHLASVVGIALIAYAVFAFDDATSFPGYAAVVPTLGASLFIAAGSTGVANRLLAAPPLVWTGLISYSLYLWHWPVTVLYQHYAPEPLDTHEIVLLGSIVIVLSLLTYFFVENPCRRITLPPIRSLLWGSAGGLTVAASALVIALNHGFPSRVPKKIRTMSTEDIMWKWDCPQYLRPKMGAEVVKSCVMGAAWETAKNHAILWGDSHAQHFNPVMDRVGKQLDLSIILRRGCPAFFLPGVLRELPRRPKYAVNCWRRNDETITWINSQSAIDLVLVASAWAGYVTDLYEHPEQDASKATVESGARLEEKGLRKALTRISSDKSIVLIGDVPRPYYDVPRCVFQNESGLLREPCSITRTTIPFSQVRKKQFPTYEVLDQVANDFNNVVFVNPSTNLCDEHGCSLYENNELIYRDSNHWRRDLSDKTYDNLISKMNLVGVIRDALSALEVESP